MCIEIKSLVDAKKVLHQEFILNYKLCHTKNAKKYMKIKLQHAYDCLKILKKSFPKLYVKYSKSILLHDIGRFYEYKDIQKFEHANYGYTLLKKYTNSLLILLPIKYHEEDLDWIKKIKKEDEYNSCSEELKKEILECSEILRDIDVISNMESILRKHANRKINTINEKLIEKLEKGNLGDKNDIINYCDEIIYILCGLSIISQENSWNYLKNKKIIEKLIKKMYRLICKDDVKNILIIRNVEKIIKKKYIY